MGLIDAHTDIDELLVELNTTASKLDSTTSDIFDTISAEEPNPSTQAIITYPEDGSTKTIPAGVTVLNFVDGIVSLPVGGNPEPMSGGLREITDLTTCHSLIISANHEVTARLDNSGAIAGRSNVLTAAGTTISLSDVNFGKVTLTTFRETIIYVIASTNPKAPKITPDVVRIIGNTSGAGTGTDYLVLVNSSGELLTSTRASRATLLDNASILSSGTTSAAHITSVGHSMFVQITSSDVGEYTVLSSPDNVTYYECETIAVNEATTGVVVPVSTVHEYIAVRNDSPDNLTATIILGTF